MKGVFKTILEKLLIFFYNHSFGKDVQQPRTSSRFFSKVFVLTIERSKKRQDQIREHLKGKLTYDIFYGVDGLQVPKESLDENYEKELAKEHYRELSLGEIGCSWSHKNIYQKIVENAWPAVLVIEDDARVDFKHWENLDQALNGLPDDWDLLYLGYKDGEIKGHLPRPLFPTKKNGKNIRAQRFKKYLMLAGSHELTVGYAVSLKGAEKLVKLQTPIQFTADGLLEHACETDLLKAYIIVPKLIYPADGIPSSIWHDNDI